MYFASNLKNAFLSQDHIRKLNNGSPNNNTNNSNNAVLFSFMERNGDFE